MSDERRKDEATYASGGLAGGHNKDAIVGVVPRKPYVDPAEEAMNQNHNLSPAIHPKLEPAVPALSS